MQENATPAKCFSRGDGSDAVPHSCFCTQKDLHRGLKLSRGAGLFTQLRQQESNLRWGSQSPLPYRLAMAHHAKQYSIFSAVPQEVRRIFAAFSVRCLPHLRRFGSVFGLCGRAPAFSIFFHVFTKGKFCGTRFSKNTVRRGHKIHIAKVKFIFFLIFLIIFSKDCIFCCGSGTLDVIKIS